eukprot:SM000012S25374  [mRNA]  locus=s12:733873:736843:- [translate_table: standard]
MLAGGGVRFSAELRPVALPAGGGAGDRIVLPPSALAALEAQGALDKGPLLFRLAVAGRSTHAGVREFTADEGAVALPARVLANLGLPAVPAPPLMALRYVRLPRGTHARLRPELGDGVVGDDFAEVLDARVVLEAELRRHSALTEGDTLTVADGGAEYALRVLEVRPAGAVSIVDTDLEVDIVPADQTAACGRRISPLVLDGPPQEGSVEAGELRYYRVDLDATTEVALNVGTDSVIVRLKFLDSSGADADLYIDRDPVRRPGPDQHRWASHDIGSKTVAIVGAGALPGAPYLSVAVRGFQGSCRYQLSAKASVSSGGHGLDQQLKQGHVTGRTNGGSTGDRHELQEQEKGFVRCSNCQQLVPAGATALHTAFCERHNLVCSFPGCGAVLRRSDAPLHAHCAQCGVAMRAGVELEKHVAVAHELLKCRCGVVLEMADMVRHKAESCPLRSTVCRFCGSLVPAGGPAADAHDRVRGLSEHESSCGARTSPCDTCGRLVMLKDVELHNAAVHGTPALGYPVPAPSGSLAAGAELTAPAAAAEPATAAPAAAVFGEEEPASASCPICGRSYAGAGALHALSSHLEEEHFGPPAGAGDTFTGGHGNRGAAAPEFAAELGRPSIPRSSIGSSGFRASARVACPICGTAVHSERDLSTHIDAVH